MMEMILSIMFMVLRQKWIIILSKCQCQCATLRKKCPNTEFFLVHIQSEYGKILTRKNSVFGHFSHSANSPFIFLIAAKEKEKFLGEALFL